MRLLKPEAGGTADGVRLTGSNSYANKIGSPSRAAEALPPPPEVQYSPWQQHMTAESVPYYWNEQTNETAWELPSASEVV